MKPKEMMQGLLARWRKPRVVSVTDFTSFLERNAWLVTQKSVIGYCTVKTKLPVHELLKEKAFADAYSISIWESYLAILADLCEVSLTYLRISDSTHAALWANKLSDFYESLVKTHPLPPHRVDTGWGAEIAEVRARLALAAQGPHRQIRDISTRCAKQLFLTLPIHARLREPDEPAVTANVQFLMVGLAHEFERIDYEALVAEMLSPAKTTE